VTHFLDVPQNSVQLHAFRLLKFLTCLVTFGQLGDQKTTQTPPAYRWYFVNHDNIFNCSAATDSDICTDFSKEPGKLENCVPECGTLNLRMSCSADSLNTRTVNLALSD